MKFILCFIQKAKWGNHFSALCTCRDFIRVISSHSEPYFKELIFKKWIVFSLLSGIFVKLALNIPLIRWLEADGAIVATAIGYSVSIIINMLVLRKR